MSPTENVTPEATPTPLVGKPLKLAKPKAPKPPVKPKQ